jgi:hypothetical protein
MKMHGPGNIKFGFTVGAGGSSVVGRVLADNLPEHDQNAATGW